MHLVFIDPGSLEAHNFVYLACDPRLESADVAVTVHKDCDSAVKGSSLKTQRGNKRPILACSLQTHVAMLHDLQSEDATAVHCKNELA